MGCPTRGWKSVLNIFRSASMRERMTVPVSPEARR